MKKLILETTAPFQGLPELVAYDEGLFEKEGLLVEWADREKGVEKKVETHVTSPKGVDPFASHGKLFEQGKADMYNACEWGNYCRVQDTGTGSRQLGRRAIVAYSALVVAPDSPVFTAQQLAGRTIGVPFYFEPTTSRCTCWKDSCRARRSSCARRRTARAIGWRLC